MIYSTFFFDNNTLTVKSGDGCQRLDNYKCYNCANSAYMDASGVCHYAPNAAMVSKYRASVPIICNRWTGYLNDTYCFNCSSNCLECSGVLVCTLCNYPYVINGANSCDLIVNDTYFMFATKNEYDNSKQIIIDNVFRSCIPGYFLSTTCVSTILNRMQIWMQILCELLFVLWMRFTYVLY